MENQKQCVSVRLSNSDILKIKRIAKRLKVSDSDIIRFGIRGMLSKLSPLSNDNASGCQLLPVFLEHSSEIIRYFDFDAERLEQVINERASKNQHIDRDDIELLATHNVFPNYLKTQLENLMEVPVDDKDMIPRLREYLYAKYGQQHSAEPEIA